MNGQLPDRWGVFVLAVLVAVFCTAHGQTSQAKLATHRGSTLRVGLWTLWHDKEVRVSATPEGGAAMRECEGCAAGAIRKPLLIRAVGARLEIGDARQAATVRLAGPVTLAAHGETITLRNPVRVAARNGQLVLAVTLPVESYVERVVASESGSADSMESLKALAIVVRSFALHQTHGHADYDLCDSTHCQLLHWGGNSERRSAAHAASTGYRGRDAVVSRATRRGMVSSELRRAHCIAAGGLAWHRTWQEANAVAGLAHGQLLHGWRRERVGSEFVFG